MKILAVQETDWIERNPIIHHRLLETMSRNGDEVVVLDFDINWRSRGRRPIRNRRSMIRGHYKVIDGSDVKIIRPAMLRIPGLGRLSWFLGTWSELRAIFRDDPPDVVVGYGISNALLSLHMAHRRSTPFVYHVLDALHTLGEPAILRRLAAVVESIVMHRADRVIVLNRGLRDYARSMGADARRIEILPVGWTRTEPMPIDGEGVRRRLGIEDDDFLLVYVGWLYDFSGLRELVRELGRRRRDLPHVKCLIVGDGDELELLRDRAKEPTLSGRLLVIGRRPLEEIPGLIAAADACLLTARRVPAMEHIVPAKVGEYMEGGKLVIATRLPGLEAEFGAVPGILFVDGPEEALARIEELSHSSAGARAEAKRLGETCLDIVHAGNDWDEVADRFRAILTAAIERTKGR